MLALKEGATVEDHSQEKSIQKNSESSARNWLLIVAIAALAAVAANTVLPGRSEGKEATFGAGVSGISITASGTGVQVRHHDGAEVTASLSGNVRGRNLVMTERGNRVDLTVESRWTLFSWGGSNLEVNIPRNARPDLEVTTSSGRITLEDLSSGDVSVRTSSGRQNHENLQVDGSFTARSSSGKIDLDDVRATSYDLSTSSGGICAEDLAGTRLNARSSSGRICLETGTLEQDWQVESSSGRVTVELSRPGDMRVEFRGSSGSWDLDNDAFRADGTGARNSLNASSGSGGPLLSVRTSSGSFRLR